MKVTTPSKLLIGRIRQVLSDNEMDISVDELAREFGDFCNDALSRLEECCKNILRIIIFKVSSF